MRYYRKILEIKNFLLIVVMSFFLQYSIAQTPPETGGCDYIVGNITLTSNNANGSVGFETIFAYSDIAGNFLGFSTVNLANSNPTGTINVGSQGTYVFYAINYLASDYSTTPINGFSTIGALNATTGCMEIQQFTGTVCEAIPSCFPSCSTQAWINLADPGSYNSSPEYTQMYAVVDALGMILQITTDGIFSVGVGANDLQEGTTYNVYAINYDSSGASYVEVGDDINAIYPTPPVGVCANVAGPGTITICDAPNADAPADVTACDSYVLPALTVGNYYTGTGGTGAMLNAGDAISATQTIYVYAETGTTPNCTDENSFVVTINTTPTAGTISGENSICVGGSNVMFSSAVLGGQWSSSDNSILIIDSSGEATGISSGTATIYYTVFGTAPCNNAVSSYEVTVNEVPMFTITGSCVGNNYTLVSSVTDTSFSYQWFNSSGMSLGNNSSLIVDKQDDYELQITSGGCTESSFITVDNAYCDIPRGISPNGDGLNDTFDLSNFDVKKLEIFNRYGMKVYSKSDYVNEWSGYSDSGDELPDATYYYVIYFNNSPARTGWVYINRQH